MKKQLEGNQVPSFVSRFEFDDFENRKPKICVVGVGGGGGNAINNMIENVIQDVDFVAINTDAQALHHNNASRKIQAGRSATRGQGAGARPNVGGQAVLESRDEIEQALHGYDMVFITAGMGGGTGTGGAPVVADIAREKEILSVAIVTRPFSCEGRVRSRSAEQGIKALEEVVDTLIVIPNERLLDISDQNTTMIEAFKMADDVLYNATRGISDLITDNGLINLDFADVRTTMANGGTALMGAATATGENRAERAARDAISSPLLDGLSIKGARNVLVNVTAGSNLGMREAAAATSHIQSEAGEEVELIFGTVIEESMGEDLRVTVIATGFDKADDPADAPEIPIHTIAEPVKPVFHVNKRDLLNEDTNGQEYKGEKNLKRLDAPTYERRSGAIDLESVSDVEGHAKTARVVRLQTDEAAKLREDRDPRDHNGQKPSFLRPGYMMD